MDEYKEYLDYAQKLYSYWDMEDHPGDVALLYELSEAAETIKDLVEQLRTLKGDLK